MLTDLLLILVLVLINGAFALSEIAIVGSRRARLAQMADAGSGGARQAAALAADPTRFFSSVQVGITSIGILSGAIGEATLTGPVRTMLEGLPAMGRWADPLSLAIVVLGITYVSLILGELVPKRLALTHPERIASVIAKPMTLLARAGRPVVWLLSVSTDGVLRALGIRDAKRAAVTIEEIKVLIEQGTEEGVLEPTEREMVTNILNLDERAIAGVLTPRAEVLYLDVRDLPDRTGEKLRQEPHDVLPVCDGGLDHVIGFVRARRVLEQVLAGRPVDLPAIVEPALFVPETMTIMTLLEEFKRTRLPAALVIDEFGGVQGIVTLSDILTSIVGELPSAEGEPAIVRRKDGSWLLDGMLDLETVARTLDDPAIAAGGGQYHTLGGLAMVSLGRVPRTGDTFDRGLYRFEVVDMDGHRVDRLLATSTTGDAGGPVPKPET